MVRSVPNIRAGSRHEVASFLMIMGTCLITVLLVRAFVYSKLAYTPLPFAEPMRYHTLTVGTLGFMGALSGLLVRGWRGILYSSLVPFLVYLSWAVIQQNLLVNPDIWKLWERGWLTVALASGLSGLAFSIVLRLAAFLFLQGEFSLLSLALSAVVGILVGYTGWDYLTPFLSYYLETHYFSWLAVGWVYGVILYGMRLIASGARSKALNLWAVAALFWLCAVLGGSSYFGLNGMDYMTWMNIIAGSAYLGAGFGGLISLLLLAGSVGLHLWRSVESRYSTK
jgi:hypothetical protein